MISIGFRGLIMINLELIILKYLIKEEKGYQKGQRLLILFYFYTFSKFEEVISHIFKKIAGFLSNGKFLITSKILRAPNLKKKLQPNNRPNSPSLPLFNTSLNPYQKIHKSEGYCIALCCTVLEKEGISLSLVF